MRCFKTIYPNNTVYKVKSVQGGYKVFKFVRGQLTEATGNDTLFKKRGECDRYFAKVADVGDVLR